MQWHDLLFMHWPVPPHAIRSFIPQALAIDEFDGLAWIGVVPFRMAGVTPRLIAPLPWLSTFPELNVRTYVTIGGKPGVWFFSLDAANPVAVEGARDMFHLKYYNARMRCQPEGAAIRYHSTRTHRGAPAATLAMRYKPSGASYRSQPGSLEHWLTERYCLYAANRQGAIWRAEVHHAPWPLQPAEAEIEHNTMTAQIGVTLPAQQPLLHFAKRLDVVGWGVERVAARP